MEDPRWMQWLAVKLGNLAVKGVRRPITALTIVGALAAGALWISRDLKLDADLTELLPRSFQSVQDLDLLRDRFGGTGYVVVVAQGGEPEALRRFADDMAPRLEKVEGIRFVEYKRATSFFEDRALYYLKTDDLREVAHRIKERERWERRQKNPLLLKLDDEPAPPLQFKDIEDRYAGSSNRRLSGDGEEYYLDPKERMVVLLAKPGHGVSADLGYAQKLVGRVQRFMDQQDLTPYGPGVKVALTGTYKKKVDQEAQISRDLGVASLISGVLMLLYLLFHFRRVAGIGFVLVPVSVGLIWTYAFVAVVYGSVNILTAFLGAILGGLGTEHGIHLLGRYIALRDEGRTAEEATRESFAHTGTSAVVSSVVAALTFAALAISEFRAFREFGVIAAVGMLVVLFAYMGAFPAMLGLLERFRWKPPPAGAVGGQGSEVAHWVPRAARPLRWAIGLPVVLLLTQIPALRFDYDFASLEDSSLPSFVLDLKTNKLLGYSQTPTVLLTDSSADEAPLVTQIEANREKLGQASTVDFAAAIGDLVPPDQEAKQEILASIDATLERVDPEKLEPAVRKDYDRLARAVKARPFTRADIPASVRRQFEGVAGESGGLVLVFPRVSMADGTAVAAFAREVRSLTLPRARALHAAGEAMILADIIDMVTRESGPVLIAAVGLVLLALYLTLGSVRQALICISPTIFSVLALVGLMGAVGIRFNFLNIVAVPVLIGTTVDAGVHLMSRLHDSHGEHFGPVLAETSRAITGGLITSAVGFAALTMADHPGLLSLGTLTILGFSLNLVIMLVGFPAVLLLFKEGRPDPEPEVAETPQSTRTGESS
jgi:predicted RND superfamily exporter protein